MNVNGASQNQFKRIEKKQAEVKQEALKQEGKAKEAPPAKSRVSADDALNFLENSKPCNNEERRWTYTRPGGDIVIYEPTTITKIFTQTVYQ